MKIGDLVVTKYTKELGIVVNTCSSHCAVLIHKPSKKRNQTFRISKEHLEVIG